ncbi:uncharacterized protein MONOS_6575 [Monocercomonoides exilis]|uniref:uncharacterized protein n=1 Tax=Monocercomonoides exilis TaxID=2049356 RepID=UPI003559CBC7|nr:hypothetical protein MONOS_6575 [Monocercomonoides exilis]|eukprot:MONOS_6575.1-p1 / transcript=MONOS_6575.1 / gene=MONOS_6575 / organism=Monocercomonoides_exilis_PA203 / gene_product=unspecified product / transcript_product=unspecified product / location=Mono_scaffold00209:53524-55809(-) / protein_length=762 / sequence_SO=supercontig / SO=protein_coding / is_pseudo=false
MEQPPQYASSERSDKRFNSSSKTNTSQLSECFAELIVDSDFTTDASVCCKGDLPNRFSHAAISSTNLHSNDSVGDTHFSLHHSSLSSRPLLRESFVSNKGSFTITNLLFTFRSISSQHKSFLLSDGISLNVSDCSFTSDLSKKMERNFRVSSERSFSAPYFTLSQHLFLIRCGKAALNKVLVSSIEFTSSSLIECLSPCALSLNSCQLCNLRSISSALIHVPFIDDSFEGNYIYFIAQTTIQNISRIEEISSTDKKKHSHKSNQVPSILSCHPAVLYFDRPNSRMMMEDVRIVDCFFFQRSVSSSSVVSVNTMNRNYTKMGEEGDESKGTLMAIRASIVDAYLFNIFETRNSLNVASDCSDLAFGNLLTSDKQLNLQNEIPSDCLWASSSFHIISKKTTFLRCVFENLTFGALSVDDSNLLVTECSFANNKAASDSLGKLSGNFSEHDNFYKAKSVSLPEAYGPISHNILCSNSVLSYFIGTFESDIVSNESQSLWIIDNNCTIDSMSKSISVTSIFNVPSILNVSLTEKDAKKTGFKEGDSEDTKWKIHFAGLNLVPCDLSFGVSAVADIDILQIKRIQFSEYVASTEANGEISLEDIYGLSKDKIESSTVLSLPLHASKKPTSAHSSSTELPALLPSHLYAVVFYPFSVYSNKQTVTNRYDVKMLLTTDEPKGTDMILIIICTTVSFFVVIVFLVLLVVIVRLRSRLKEKEKERERKNELKDHFPGYSSFTETSHKNSFSIQSEFFVPNDVQPPMFEDD